ncbi:hypothetical protein JCM10212_003356 [Sporobolomyces blumeae]
MTATQALSSSAISSAPSRRRSRHARRGSATLDSAATALESSVVSIANAATKAVKGQGVCSSEGTCAGFIRAANTCSGKDDATAIAECICSETSLDVMVACTDCIASGSIKTNAKYFESFCAKASATLAILAAETTSPSPSSTSFTPSSSTPPLRQSSTGSASGRSAQLAKAVGFVISLGALAACLLT